MASEYVLRIPRSDSAGEYVILNVNKNGSALLDLKLVATEGTNPYVAESIETYTTNLRRTFADGYSTVKQAEASKFLAKNSSTSAMQWETVLRSILLRRREQSDASEVLENLEVVASLTGGQLVLVFRKNISGFHQRIGELSLKQDDDIEIDTVSWVITAVTRADFLEKKVEDLSNKFHDQGKVIKKLNTQLEDLIEAKKDHEASLYEKFRLILNAKKLKIRDQQRLLATSKVNPDTADHVSSARFAAPLSQTKSSRSRKRKSKIESSESQSAVEDSGFEKMDIDDHRFETPEKSDRGAIDDDDLDMGPTTQNVDHDAESQTKVARNSIEEREVPEPPPRRELPFVRAGETRREPSPAVAVEKEKKVEVIHDSSMLSYDSETSDDEL